MHSARIGIVLLMITIFVVTAGGLSAQTEWDKSSIVLTGECQGDEAVFTVLNHGADMAGESAWREYEADELRTSGAFQLAADESQEWRFSPTPSGTPVRFEADQRVGHPGASAPKLTLTCQPTAVKLFSFRAGHAGIDLLSWIRRSVVLGR